MEMESPVRSTKQSNARKYGFIVLLVLLLMALGALTYLLKNTFLTRNNSVSEMTAPICDTDICKYTAQHYLHNMDPTVNPCENFYRFACGGFIKTVPIPPEKKKISVSDELENKIQNQLKQLLSNLSSQEISLARPYANLVQMYSSCMNQEKESNESVQESRKIFLEAGGWPLLDKNSLPDDWTFQQTEQNLKKVMLEGNSLLKTSVQADSSGIHFVVEKPKLILPENILTKGSDFPEVKAYQQYLIDITVLYGADREEATQIMKHILDFEIPFAALLKSRKDNAFSSNYTINDLKNLPSMKWINWTELLMVLLPKTIIITDAHVVIIKDFEYIDVLNEFLKTKQQTDIVNYMFWRAAESLGPLVSKELRARKIQESMIAKDGLVPSQWRHCLDLMKSHMDVALSSIYVKHFVNVHTKSKAEIITENIRQEMIHGIQQTSGIDKELKKAVTERINKVVAHIAYPQELTDVTKLEAYYDTLTISNGNFLRKILDVRKWKQDIMVFQSVENYNTFEWTTFADATSPKATFSAKDRLIVLNAGLLQPPVYSPSLPLYVNYGSVGYLVGHHLTHAQEDQPSVGSNTTVGRIVYKGALKLAYGAYHRQQKQLAPQALLPGLLQYSADQLLMLSMANTLCTRHSQLIDKTQTEIRVNTVAKGSPEFSHVFNCSQGCHAVSLVVEGNN